MAGKDAKFNSRFVCPVEVRSCCDHKIVPGCNVEKQTGLPRGVPGIVGFDAFETLLYQVRDDVLDMPGIILIERMGMRGTGIPPAAFMTLIASAGGSLTFST